MHDIISSLWALGPVSMFAHRYDSRAGVSLIFDDHDKLTAAARQLGSELVQFADSGGDRYLEASALRGSVSIRAQMAVRRGA